MQRRFVEHYTDGQNSWSYDYFGLLKRIRGIVSMVLIGLLSGGWFSWYYFVMGKLGGSFEVPVFYFILGVVIFIFLIIILFLLIARSKSIKSLRLKGSSHSIMHYMRDRISAAEQFSRNGNKSQHGAMLQELFRGFCDESCNLIRSYFRCLIGDQTIEVALRIADKAGGDPNCNQVLYATAGRSDGLNPNRDRTSKSIPASEGVPLFFLKQKGCRGVVFFNDLNEAIRQGAFLKTKNEELYPKEIKTIMVAPVNGWCRHRTDMVGLLYITSQKDVFRIKHMDSLRAFADVLGVAIPRIALLYFDYRKKKNKK